MTCRFEDAVASGLDEDLLTVQSVGARFTRRARRVFRATRASSSRRPARRTVRARRAGFNPQGHSDAYASEELGEGRLCVPARRPLIPQALPARPRSDHRQRHVLLPPACFLESGSPPLPSARSGHVRGAERPTRPTARQWPFESATAWETRTAFLASAVSRLWSA